MRLVKDKRGTTYILAILANDQAAIKLGLYTPETGTRLLDYLHASIHTKTFIHIDDIWVDEYEQNKAHGSILLEALLAIAKRRGYTKVMGKLTSKDADHFDVLEHFFQKHGFKVVFNAATSGYILKYIHQPLYFH